MAEIAPRFFSFAKVKQLIGKVRKDLRTLFHLIIAFDISVTISPKCPMPVSLTRSSRSAPEADNLPLLPAPLRLNVGSLGCGIGREGGKEG